MERLLAVLGNDPLRREVQANVFLTFRMHVRARRRALEDVHFDREAFEWVLGKIEANFNHSR